MVGNLFAPAAKYLSNQKGRNTVKKGNGEMIETGNKPRKPNVFIVDDETGFLSSIADLEGKDFPFSPPAKSGKQWTCWPPRRSCLWSFPHFLLRGLMVRCPVKVWFH